MCRTRLSFESLEDRSLCSIVGGELQGIIDLPSGTPGSGITIALIEYGRSPSLQTDFNSFCASSGLKPYQVLEVRPLGAVPDNTGSTWDIETTLDVCAAHAAAPYARLIVVESPTASPFDMDYCAEYATKFAQVVSMSYGAPDYGAAIDNEAWYSSYTHTMFVAASGDSPKPTLVPSADNNVLSVGAAEITVNALGQLRGISVAKWSGRGISDDFGRRWLPDVIAPGGGTAALALPVHGVWYGVYGTSEAAPIEAGVIADQESVGHERWDAPEYRAFLKQHAHDMIQVKGGKADGYGFPDAARLVADSIATNHANASIDLPIELRGANAPHASVPTIHLNLTLKS